tara:strand:- start:740 stop:1000 length:261 start_codon:yes stop_codon:yes gene_type:complete
MEDNNNLYHLLVNPYKVNRNKKVIKETTIDDILINILKKKYHEYSLSDKDYDYIINNLNKLVLDLDIKNLINNFVDNTIEESINII